MTYQEFVAWANQRACDGCWGMGIAITCVHIISEVDKVSRFSRKREKYWQTYYAETVENEIVKPIDNKIKELEDSYNGKV